VARIALICLLSLVFAALAGATAPAAERPDLRLSFFLSPPQVVVPGQTFSLATVTRNTGRAATRRRTSTAVWFSRDKTRDVGDVPLGAAGVGALRARSARLTGFMVRVPEQAQGGSYYLLYCADASNRVRESIERNNCVVAANTAFVRP